METSLHSSPFLKDNWVTAKVQAMKLFCLEVRAYQISTGWPLLVIQAPKKPSMNRVDNVIDDFLKFWKATKDLNEETKALLEGYVIVNKTKKVLIQE